MVYKKIILSAIVLFFVSSVILLFIIACESIFPAPEPITYTITALIGNNGDINPEGKIIVPEGEDQNFSITPDEGYRISDILVDGESVGALSGYTFTDVRQDHTIQVIFLKKAQPVLPITTKKYTITASSGTGGTIEPEGNIKVNKGDDKVFTIIADDGYQIINVKIDGTSFDNIGQTDNYIYTFADIQANHTIEVSFIQQFTIKTSAGDNGSIEPEGEISVLKGESQTFTITPDICYQIEKIIINATEDIETESPYIVDDIQEDYSIEVSFILSDKKIRRYNQDGELQNDNYTSIHAAINDEDTTDGDTIIVCPGTYYENLTFNGSKKITVQSVDPENEDIKSATNIDGGGEGSVATFINGDDSILQGFTITKGSGTSTGSFTAGGGIYINNSNPNISCNIIEDNESANGGGIYVAGDSSPEIEKNIIRNNESTNMAGGIYIINSSPKVFNNIISDNLAYQYGGGIYVNNGYIESNNSISVNVIKNNQASHDGGGIYLSNASPRLTNNDIKNNNANNYGGGIYIEGGSPDITENNFISRNSAANGGGIYTKNAYIDSENCITGNIIVNNTASSSGGGFYIEKSTTFIIENIIGSNQNNQGNSAKWGGGIYMVNSNNCNIEKNAISGNMANIGGGIYVNRSLPTIKGNTISCNIVSDAMDGSGGIFVNSNSSILPGNIGRPADWGIGRGNIPSTALDDPPKDIEYQIAGNTFIGNEHSDSAGNITYSEGAHVYFN